MNCNFSWPVIERVSTASDSRAVCPTCEGRTSFAVNRMTGQTLQSCRCVAPRWVPLRAVGEVVAPAVLEAAAVVGEDALDVVRDQTWSAVPLFTWMGLVVVASGFAESLYRSAYKWIGHLPGGGHAVGAVEDH